MNNIIQDEEEIELEKKKLPVLEKNEENEMQIEQNNENNQIEEENNMDIYEDNKLRLVDRIDWTKLCIIKQNENYSIEEASIKDQPAKILRIIRIKKVENYEDSEDIFVQTKNNYKLLIENREKFKNMPTIFDLKEVNEKELIVVIQYFKYNLNLSGKYESIDYIKWLLDNVSDLLLFIELGITFNSIELEDSSFVQERMNYSMINPLIFICKKVLKQQNANEIELENSIKQEIIKENYKTNKQNQDQLQKLIQNNLNINVQDMIVKSILACISDILQRNIFQIDIMSTKNKNFEKLIYDLIEEILKKEKDDTIKIKMKDFQKNERKYILQVIKKKKGKKYTKKIKITSNNHQELKVQYQEELDKLRSDLQIQEKESFQSINQHLYDMFIQLYEQRKDINQANQFLKQSYQIEKNLKKKCMISINDERNVKRLKQLLSKGKNGNKQLAKDNDYNSDQNKISTTKDSSSNKKQNQLKEQNENKIDIFKRQANISKKKMPVPKKNQTIKMKPFQDKQKENEQENLIDQECKQEEERGFDWFQSMNKKQINNTQSIEKNIPKKNDENMDLQFYKVHTVKFAFSIFADQKEVPSLYKTLYLYKNDFISLSLLFTNMHLTSKTLKKYIFPILSFPNLQYMRLNLNGCFQTRPIFWDEDSDEHNKKDNDQDYDQDQNDVIEEEDKKENKTNYKNKESQKNINFKKSQLKNQKKQQSISDDEQSDEDEESEEYVEYNDDSICEKDIIERKNLKQSWIQDIIDELIQKCKNDNLEFFEIHLEKNYARDEDIDILFEFLKGAFKNIRSLQIAWKDAYITEKQLTQICNHYSFFKDKLQQVGLTLWKNIKLGDEQVKEICNCFSQFTKLGYVTLGLLECKITDEVGIIIGDFLKACPFLLNVEIGFDGNNLNSALGYLSEGFKTQKLLTSIGISFEDSQIDDESFEQFSHGLHEMYSLEDFHFFVAKNHLQLDSPIQFFKTLSECSRQLKIIDINFQKNNLSQPGIIEQFSQFLKYQFNLTKIELCFDNTKLKGEGIAMILDSINRCQQIDLIHLNLQNCCLNTKGFLAISNLLHELHHPLLLTLLRLYVSQNVMNLNEEQQGVLASTIQRFPNITELDLDFSGCHLYNDFFTELSKGVQSLIHLESYTLLLFRCFLSHYKMNCIVINQKIYFISILKAQNIMSIFNFQICIFIMYSLYMSPCSIKSQHIFSHHLILIVYSRFKLIFLFQKIEGLANKHKLEELSLEFEDSEIPAIDLQYEPYDKLKIVNNIYMPSLKQLTLNFLRCSWSFNLINSILVQIGADNYKQKQLMNFNSLNIYVCSQEIDEYHVVNFVFTVNTLYSNAVELTLNFEDCDLDLEKTTNLFNFKLNKLRTIDLCVNDNIELNMKMLSLFLANQTNLQYLGLKLKGIKTPIEDFNFLGSALKYFNLKSFNLYMEQSQLNYSRNLEGFYNGLSSQHNIEAITLHLHVILY